MKVITAFIGLGSNLDNPKQHVLDAIEDISQEKTITVVKQSSLYQSSPLDGSEQPDYINAVIQISTALSPFELLSKLNAIEDQHGRKRRERWGARTLDLDLLLYGNALMTTHILTIPHYGIKDRDFVLVPLNEIDDSLILPDGSPIKQLLSQLKSVSVTQIDDIGDTA